MYIKLNYNNFNCMAFECQNDFFTREVKCPIKLEILKSMCKEFELFEANILKLSDLDIVVSNVEESLFTNFLDFIKEISYYHLSKEDKLELFELYE